MKPTMWLMMVTALLLAPRENHAQCTPETMKSITYDTTVMGSGNASHVFTFPKFNPALGTLVEVNISPEITLNYSFQLENKELIPILNYKVKAYRDDEISGDALLNPLVNSYQKSYGPYILAAADGLPGLGLDFLLQPPAYVMNHKIVNYTVYNTADFLGTGTVNFDYTTTTYSAVMGSINNLFNGTALDTVGFKITYKYCQITFLAADINSFTAIKRNDDLVDIKWITQNEKNSRNYELQKSADGRNFTGVAKFAAQANANQTGTYSHQYQVQASDSRKVIFRVKQTDKDGTVKYSPLRIIEVNKPTGKQLTLYPNPVSKTPVNIVFSNTIRGNWQVYVYAVTGTLMQQQRFNNALTGTVNTNTLQRGMYLVKAVNQDTQEQVSNRLVVQ